MRVRNSGSVLFALTLLGSTPLVAHADAYADGLQAYEANHYEKAVAIWTTLAEQGNVQAQFNLGFIHEFGYGVAVDPAAAFRWYLRAAEGGHQQARRFVAWMYDNGKGVPRDVGKARDWQRIDAANSESGTTMQSTDEDDATFQRALLNHMQAELRRAATRYDLQQTQPAMAPIKLEAANWVG